MTRYSFGTLCLHAGKPKNLRPHNIPIGMSVSWQIRSDSELSQGLEGRVALYGRLGGSDAIAYVERKICALETLRMNGGGARARLRADGMNAISMVLHGALQKPGDHAIVIGPIYGGTYELIREFQKRGYDFTFLAAKDRDLAAKTQTAISDKTRLIIGEETTNPTLALWDLEETAKIAHNHAKAKPLVAVDASFLSPYNLRPFEWQADIVVHSATKYLGAHGAFTSGIVVVSKETLGERPDFWEAANSWANFSGGTPGEQEAWLLGIFMEDLHTRVPLQNQNAMMIARFLEEHPKIASVSYPGLASYPQQSLANKILRTPDDGHPEFGGMISFRTKGGPEAVRRLLYALNAKTIIKHKPSLGYTKTIAESPWALSQRTMTPEHKKMFGITEDLMRLSCGTEATHDLLRALEKGLKCI